MFLQRRVVLDSLVSICLVFRPAMLAKQIVVLIGIRLDRRRLAGM
jgi:hypothetical protein